MNSLDPSTIDNIIEHLCKYNPSLKKGIVPKVDIGYSLLVPKEYALKFEEKRHLLGQDPYIYNPSYTPPAVSAESNLADNGSSEATVLSGPNNVISNKPVEEKKLTLSEIATSIAKRDPKLFANTPAQEMNSDLISDVRKTPATAAVTYKIIKVTDVQKKTIYHSVRKGENLTTIADKYDISLKELRDWNNLNSNSNLFVGKKLKIEQLETIVRPQYAMDNKAIVEDNTVSSVTDNVIVHKIRKGENLMQLTRLYNCSLTDLKEWNKLKSPS